MTTIVVDKTGTLTEGKPRLVTVEPQSPFDDATLLRLAASLENVSEHPLAAAIVAGARDRNMRLSEVRDFESATGRGVTGTVEGHVVTIGMCAISSGSESPSARCATGPSPCGTRGRR